MAKAIGFLYENFQQQPSLEEVAKVVHLSPFHFQRMFTEWVGVSPKKFLQFVSIQYAKEKLRKKEINLFQTTEDTGLSSTGRLHDLFVKVEAMTPGEYKNGGQNLDIFYNFNSSPFGEYLVASTEKGICHIAFFQSKKEAFSNLEKAFPEGIFIAKKTDDMKLLYAFFNDSNLDACRIHLHLRGTPFQLKVWSALLKIPAGELNTYGEIAEKINSPKASRAVGTAIGSNPIAFLIPCHRVIRSTGIIGDYRWGSERKIAMIGYEGVKTSDELPEN